MKEFIDRYRGEHTQRHVAEVAGIAEHTITNWKRRSCSATVYPFLLLCRALAKLSGYSYERIVLDGLAAIELSNE